MTRNSDARPEDDRPGAAPSIPTWGETYADALNWIEWSGRRHWPTYPVNNELWAASIADWYHHGRPGRAR